MPIDDMGKTSMPIGEETWAAAEFPEETKEKRKKNRLIVNAGPVGPQLAIVPAMEPYPEEEDPNP